MHHADKIIARIIFLEGHPNLQSLAPLRIGQNVKEVLESDLAGEYDARTSYKKSREICHDLGDYVTMELFEDLLADEEGHIDFLETQLGLLGHYPYSWPAPNGYPDSNAKWLSAGAMVSRWNTASYVAVGFWFGAPTFDITRIVGSNPPATVGEAVDRVGSGLLGTALPPADRAAILSALGTAESAPWKSWYNTRGLLAYVLQSPLNQVR